MNQSCMEVIRNTSCHIITWLERDDERIRIRQRWKFKWGYDILKGRSMGYHHGSWFYIVWKFLGLRGGECCLYIVGQDCLQQLALTWWEGGAGRGEEPCGLMSALQFHLPLFMCFTGQQRSFHCFLPPLLMTLIKDEGCRFELWKLDDIV